MHAVAVAIGSVLILGAATAVAPAAAAPHVLPDPAARLRWTGPSRLVVESAGGPERVVREIDAETGVWRRLTDDEIPPESPQEPQGRRRRPRGTDGRGDAAGPDGPPLPSAAAPLTGPHHWSPDASHLVAWDVEPAEPHPVHIVESSPLDRLQPRLITFDYYQPGDRVERSWPRLFRADGTEISLDRRLFANPWTISEVRWAADGRSFTFLYNQRGHQVLRLVAVDVATGAARTIVEETSPTFVDYPHKTWLHWLSDTELLWTSERDGCNHIYGVAINEADPAGSSLRRVTEGPWILRYVDHVDPEARTLTLRVMGLVPDEDPYHFHFIRVPIDGGETVQLTDGDGTHELLWSPDRRWYTDSFSRVDLPPVHELRRASDGSLVCELGRADAAGLLATGWRLPERFVAKGRDGATDIHGVIWRPQGTADTAEPHPVVESIYAGPHDFHVPKTFRVDHRQQAMADEGFVVVAIDGMGTNWRGKAFHDVCWKNLRDSGLPDRIRWIQAAAAERPWMDLSRVGIYGGSAGGQSALRALLDFPDFYKVAVADCGCHDNRMDKIWWNELWMGWPVDESYERNSNTVDAHRLRGELMLIVGELDHNVDPASTLQVSAALVKAGKLHELVVIPGTGHGAAETSYGSRKRVAFLRRHLLGK